MSIIPPLNYFMEKEAARVAAKNFSLTLQEAFKEYKKIWNMYLDLVKKCEDDTPRSLSSSKTKVAGQKNGNSKRTRGTYINEEDMTNSAHSLEDTLLQFPADLHSSMEESNEENLIEKTKRDAMSRSPVFIRNNSNSRNSLLKEINSAKSPSTNMTMANNINNNKEQENIGHSHGTISTSSTTNITSPLLLCSTPVKNKKWSKSKKQTVKKSKRSKLTTPSSTPKKRNNLVNIRKKQTNKVPLKIINNVNLIPKKNVSQADKNNSNRSNNMLVTSSPSSRKFKQTKLIFNKTNETMELSNDCRSPNTSQTITNKSASSQEKNLRQGTLTDSMNLSQKRTNDEHNGNNYKQIEVNENRTVNNFVHICTNSGVKDELILLQENDQIDSTEESNPINISNESDMTFFSDYENDRNLNKSHNASSDSNSKKKHINSIETGGNIEDIYLEEPTDKKGLYILQDENCDECIRYGKKYCSYHRDISHKGRNASTNSCAILSDCPSSTT